MVGVVGEAVFPKHAGIVGETVEVGEQLAEVVHQAVHHVGARGRVALRWSW